MNGNKDTEGISLFVEKLYLAMKKLISQAEFDRTSIGQVIEVNEDNLYTVAAFGGTYKLTYKSQLQVGNVVRVKIPQNIWKDMYIESVE